MLTEVLKALLERLHIGIVITSHDHSIVLSNSLLSKDFTDEEQFKLQVSRLVHKKLVPAVNTPFQFNGRKGIVRKEVAKVFEEEYDYYFFFFSNNNDFLHMDPSEEFLFKDLSELADESMVVVDTEGYIQILTRSFANFLGVDLERSIGKHVTEVIENTRMHIVAKT
ncbi:MAG TPA: hypothetical protein ACFYEC_08115, partial [Candidatus Brocadiaceae bacterium]